MNYGKHSACHGKHTSAGKHSIPHRSGAAGKGLVIAGLAIVLSATCVPVGISIAQPAQQDQKAPLTVQSTQMSETPEAEEMTPQEKAAIDRIVDKYTLSTGEKAVKIARRFLGTPYVWGGAQPGGFDCSGLTQYVYGKLGVNLDHFAATQYGQGKRVSQDKLEAGDLVFFDDGTGAIQHVGFYIGKGKYLHAPKTGDVVKISKLSERTDYVGACRPY